MTASSIACTPLFLKALPHSIGTISLAMVRLRMPWRISSSVSGMPARYFSSKSSLASAAASTIFSRHSVAEASRSSGMSMYSNFTPWLASSQMMAFIFTRSTTPWKCSSAPTGICITTALPLRRSAIWVCTRKKSAPTRSILLTKATRGTLYLLAWRQTVSDCGCTPPTASYTMHAPSSTRIERSTSMVKSTCPGVSMMLIRCSG